MKKQASRRQFIKQSVLVAIAALSLSLLSARAAETNAPLTTIPSDINYKSHYA